MIDALIQALRTTPPEPGTDRVLVVGDPEFDAEAARRARGMPFYCWVTVHVRLRPASGAPSTVRSRYKNGQPGKGCTALCLATAAPVPVSVA